jgi:transcriptional regulator with XRE-family HTH domain
MLRVTKERKRQKWTQAELARRAWINASTLSLIESGHYKPYDSQLIKLANALGFTDDPHRLLDEIDQ